MLTCKQLINDDGEIISFELPVFDESLKFYWEKEKKHTRAVLQAIADVVINQPYQLDPSLFLKTTLNEKDYTLYRPNHDTTHAARQFFYTKELIHYLSTHASARWRAVIDTLTAEERAIMQLASFCLRIGRRDENQKNSHHTQYSAILFENIANQLGFEHCLAQNVKQAMFCGKPFLREQERYDGFSGDTDEDKLNKAKLFNTAFDIVHRADLVRCWDSKKENKFNAIYKPQVAHFSYLIENEQESSAAPLLFMHYAARACLATGNKVHLENKDCAISYHENYRKKRKAKCVNDITFCFKKLKEVPSVNTLSTKLSK